MSQVSANLTEDLISSLRERYKIPQEAMGPEIDNLLYRLNDYEGELGILPDRLQDFQNIAEGVLSSQLSAQNMQLLKEACSSVLDEYANPKSILNDAKHLFKIHVVSVIKETKKSLHHGSALEKVGASLAFVGKALDGISIFWDELAKKHAILKVIDICVLKPLIISFYSAIIPELSIIKACEFVGRAMIEKAKTGEWKSSILSSASAMANSATKHFERLFGTSYQSKFIDAIGNISNLGENQKDALKAVVSSEEGLGMIMQCIQNPKTAAASVAGAMLVSKMTVSEVKISLKIMQEILYGEGNKEHKINIEAFCKGADVNDKIAQSLIKVFETGTGGHLPKAPKALSDIINIIQDSRKIEDTSRQNLIQFLVAYAVKNELDKVYTKEDNTKEPSKVQDNAHVEREETRRDTTNFTDSKLREQQGRA